MVKAVIVDDDMTTLNGLRNAVDWDALDIEVVALAQNGQEGLQLIDAHDPDLILTDIYMPVMDGIEMLKALRRRGNSAEVVILSGYEDFKYAQSAVKLQVNDYVSKPATIEEIEGVLKETVDKIKRKAKSAQEEQELRELLAFNLAVTKRQLFKSLLERGPDQTPHMKKLFDYLRVDLSDRYFSVVVIEFLKDRERLDCKPSDWSLFSYAVENIVDETARKLGDIYVADIQLQSIALIVSTPKSVNKEAAGRRAKRIAEEVSGNINRYLKLHVWTSVGCVADSADDIRLSYREAIDLLADRERMIGKRVITKDDWAPCSGKTPRHRPIEAVHAIVDAAVMGVRESAEERIRELDVALRTPPGWTVGMLRDFAIEFYGVLVVALYEHGLRSEDIRSGPNVHKELESIYSADDLTSWIGEIVRDVCAVTERRAAQKHKKTIDFIIRFVREHYAEDITLDTIAEKVYLTRNYLSQIFKQATGENYNSFLTRVRMEKAKELMLTGNYKLYEISQMVGYKNNAYFSQLFKKYTGCNPSEFNQ